MPHAPLAAVLSLVLAAAAVPALAGSAAPAVATASAPAAVIAQQPDLAPDPASDWAIDWRSLQDIVLERLRDAPAPTDAAAPAAARPLSVQCLTTKGSCTLSVDGPVAFGLPCHCDGSDAPGTIR